MKINFNKATFSATIMLLLLLFACHKNDYYVDGGLAHQSEVQLHMSTYDFLSNRDDHLFDSLVKIIDLTNTKNIVNQQNITFYVVPNSGVMRFQRRYNATDRLAPKPLSEIGIDTLKMLLNRFIIPNNEVKLGQTDKNYVEYYKDNNKDSLLIYYITGISTPGSAVRTSADRMEYEHRIVPGMDSLNYRIGIQTHNLVTNNAVLHILSNGSNFSGGFKMPFFRLNDN